MFVVPSIKLKMFRRT